MEWQQDLVRVEEMMKHTMLGRKVMDWSNKRYPVVKKGKVAVSS